MAKRKTSSMICEKLKEALSAKADTKKAAEMAAYMKTDMPFYGVQTRVRVTILKEILKEHPILDRDTYEDVILSLWRLPHREEKYCAIYVAQWTKKLISAESFPLFEKLIREGAWWDFVDAVASECVGRTQLKERKKIEPIMDRWIDDGDMWIRRTAILSQLHHKDKTNEAQLFRYCLARAHEKEFFIRKAIGWALRDYARTAPESVKRFITENRAKLSPLSFREAGKHLDVGGK